MGDEAVIATVELEEKMVGGDPITVDLRLTCESQQALQRGLDDPDKSIALRFVGLQPPARARLSVRVFLNLPEADIETSADSPHYVGSFSFFGESPEADSQLLLDSVLTHFQEADEWTPRQPLQVTIFVAPINEDERAESVPLEQLQLLVVPN